MKCKTFWFLSNRLPNQPIQQFSQNCSSFGVYIERKWIHDCILEKGIIFDIILSNAIITMYKKCGSLINAETLFVRMPKKDVVSCIVLVVSYAEQGQGSGTLFLFKRMLQTGWSPHEFTFCSVLNACARRSTLPDGRILYSVVIERRINYVLGNSLTCMYGECGIIQDPHNLFIKREDLDNISLNAIICAYANHGSCEDVLRLFQGLQEQWLKPSKITFITVLCACSHVDAMNTGYTYFDSMNMGGYSILPTYKHYVYDRICW